MYLTNALCRTLQGTVIPFGTAGIMVSLPFCRPVLMVTIWDVVCLLWAYYIYHEDGFRGGDELSRQIKLPCQNASQLDRQNHYDGSEPGKPPINSEFDDLGGKRGDYTTHVWDINSTNVSDIQQQ